MEVRETKQRKSLMTLSLILSLLFTSCIERRLFFSDMHGTHSSCLHTTASLVKLPRGWGKLKFVSELHTFYFILDGEGAG